MNDRRRVVMFSVIAGSLALLAWAGPIMAQKPAAKPAAKPEAKPAAKAPASPTGKPAEKTPATKPKPAPADAAQVEPAKLALPKVSLTAAHAKTCRVKVGDEFPAIELKDLAGKKHALRELLGEKLTVVTFWTADNPYAVEELADLAPDVLARYEKQGVRVVGIDVQDSPAVAGRAVAALKLTYPVLHDTDGAALAQCAAGRRLPRTYLLDADGKIVWFDIEYSRSTRRELLQSLRFLLNNPG